MIKRAIEILKNHTEGNYIELAEKELGYEVDTSYGIFGNINGEEEPQSIQEANRKIYSLSDDIQEKEWEELWNIFKGQNHTAYVMLMDRLSKEEQRNGDHWNKWFDGTGVRGWWD